MPSLRTEYAAMATSLNIDSPPWDLSFGYDDAENTILQASLDRILVHATWEGEAATELAFGALSDDVLGRWSLFGLGWLRLLWCGDLLGVGDGGLCGRSLSTVGGGEIDEVFVILDSGLVW